MNNPHHIVTDLIQRRDLKNLHNSIYIELDNYFAHSGMEESNSRLIKITPKYRAKKNTIRINNDMTKYKLTKYN